jgi:ABC-type uncharacterized transport system substrate-binding protein
MASHIERRKLLVTFGGAAAAWPLAARAQQSTRMRRIGIVMPYAKGDSEVEPRVRAFKQELAKLGWTEGGNIQFEEHWTTDNMDIVRAHAASLVASNPDIIVATGGRVIPILMRLSRSIPMVLPSASDPGRHRLGAKPGAAGRQCHGLHRVRTVDPRQVARNLKADCARDRSRGADLQSRQSQFRPLSAHLRGSVRSTRRRGHRPLHS